ncbi:MAG: alginate export family protein [Bryobacteraceae bacterium]
MLRRFRRHAASVAFTLTSMATTERLSGQAWDLGSRAANQVSKDTEGALNFSFEFRTRFESRPRMNFGRDPDLETGLFRTRVGMAYRPAHWLKISGMLQDSRSPGYGDNAPSSVRDQADLHEAYVEILPDAKTGFGMTAGRMMLNYGDARLIGSTQWSNLARTYDHTRLYYRFAKARFEVLMVSPVKIRIGEFNPPVLGDRVWGTYNTFNTYKKSQLDVYVLRHDQNRPGGFTGGSRATNTDKMGVNTLGARLAGPLGNSVKYGMELVLQNGKVGPARQSAAAAFGAVTKHFLVSHRTLDVSGEYKYASGTKDPGDTLHSHTFDQLYPANHDKFGHQDLFGWRNLHNVRSVTALGVTKDFDLNFMYNDIWLASASDSLYSSSGASIVRSAKGNAGRFVGQGTDLFGTYKYKHFVFGAGYGYWFNGGFLRNTTPGASPNYGYLFQTYSF